MAAIDRDGPGVNSLVAYGKEGEDSDKFSVDQSTGIVTIAAGQRSLLLGVGVSENSNSLSNRPGALHEAMASLVQELCWIGRRIVH